MGIIRAPRDHFLSDHDEVVIEDDYFLLVNDDEIAANTDDEDSRRRRRAKQKLRPKATGGSKSSVCGGKPKTGKRGRRYENTLYLLNLEEDEFGPEQLSIHDFVPEHFSAFAQLLAERGKMKIWNEFINMSEGEQENVLKKGRWHHKSTFSKIAEEEEEQEDEKKEKTAESVETMGKDDKRIKHPSYSCAQCFSSIDAKLQMMLRKGHVPFGLMSNLEEEVRSFFVGSPDLVMVSRLENGFERRILHAVCQYLGLHSHSYDIDGIRHTQIENPWHCFEPPCMTLSAYIDSTFFHKS